MMTSFGPTSYTIRYLPTGNRRNLGLRVVAPRYGCSAISAGRLFDTSDEWAAALRCLWQCMRKFRQDRRAHSVRTGASCVTVAAEHCLDFFVAREVSPGGAFFDNSPLFFGKVIVFAPLLDLTGKARNFLLVRLRPSQTRSRISLTCSFVMMYYSKFILRVPRPICGQKTRLPSLRSCEGCATRSPKGEAWCPWPESNQHSLRNSILSRARLPVPPQGPSDTGGWAGGREAGGI